MFAGEFQISFLKRGSTARTHLQHNNVKYIKDIIEKFAKKFIKKFTTHWNLKEMKHGQL